MADNVTAGGVAVTARDVTYSGDASKNMQVIGLALLSGADDAKVAADISDTAPLPVKQGSRIRITATPTIAGAAYVSGDQYGTVMTFASIAQANGGGGKIVNAVMTNRDTDSPVLELWLFRVSPTMVNADSGTFDLTDANLEAAEFVGVIDFVQWYNTAAGQASVGQHRGEGLGASPIEYICGSSSTSLFGIMCSRSAFTQGGASDVILALTAIRD